MVHINQSTKCDLFKCPLLDALTLIYVSFLITVGSLFIIIIIETVIIIQIFTTQIQIALKILYTRTTLQCTISLTVQ